MTRLEAMPPAGELQPGYRGQRHDAQGAAEPHERQHQLADHRISVRRHWRSLAIFSLLSIALCLRAAAWSVKVSTNSPAQNSFFTVGTFTSPNGFAEIQAPNGATIAAGSVVTITNATAALSNGTLTITAAIASNSLAQIAGMSATNLPIKLNLVGQ